MSIKNFLTTAVIVAGVAAVVLWKWGSQIEFVLGGAMVNIGYRLQDPIEDYDFEHHDLSAEEIWQEFLRQNDMAASVRDIWPPNRAASAGRHGHLHGRPARHQ